MLQKNGTEKQTTTPTKINARKEGLPAATKLPVAPTKTNATKEGVPEQQHLQKLMLQKKEYQQQHLQKLMLQKKDTSSNKVTSSTYKN